MPTIPKGFRPITSGYNIGSPGGAMRTEVAGGAPRYGLDWDRGVQQFNVTLLLTKLQFSIWTAFYLQVIKKGTITFDMPLDSGFGESMHPVNIVPGSYGASDYNGFTIAVSFVVETESQGYELSEGAAAALVEMYGEYGDSLQSLYDRLAQFANVDTNVLNF